MSVLTNQPTNFNLLSNNKFRLSFRRIPNTVYYCQSVTIPSLINGGPILGGQLGDLQLPGDKLQSDSIQITFLIDEDLKAYKELYNWMIGLTFPEDFSQFTNLSAGEGEFSDAELVVLSNNSNPIHTFHFENVHIQTLGPLDFFTNAGDEPLICTGTFAYQPPFKITSF